MAICQYIADSARLPQPHILCEERHASTSTIRARVLGAGVPPSSAISFTIAA
jgi:hypothetical protein